MPAFLPKAALPFPIIIHYGIENYIIKPTICTHKSNIYGLKPMRKVTSFGLRFLPRSWSDTVLKGNIPVLNLIILWRKEWWSCKICIYVVVPGTFFLLTQLRTLKRKKPRTLCVTVLFVWPPLPPFLIQCDNLWWSISSFFCLSNSKEESQITWPFALITCP